MVTQVLVDNQRRIDHVVEEEEEISCAVSSRLNVHVAVLNCDSVV